MCGISQNVQVWNGAHCGTHMKWIDVVVNARVDVTIEIIGYVDFVMVLKLNVHDFFTVL